VAEGIINNDRIIKTMNVIDDSIGIDVKGLYSVEKFIIARRLMYWQVYLHKTVLSAEALLIRILRRARHLSRQGEILFATPSFSFFLKNEIDRRSFLENPEILDHFANIDDFDIFTSIKTWAGHGDFILSTLSRWLMNRELYRVEMQTGAFEEAYISGLQGRFLENNPIAEKDLDYFVFHDVTSNYTYDPGDNRINVLLKNGEVMDLTEASGLFNLTLLTEPDVKHLAGYPKNMGIVKK
jgi:HD superfamily phosphohydrolase